MLKKALPIVKAALVIGIITWLIKSGKLNFKELSVFISDPYLLIIILSTWTFGFTFLAAKRLQLITRGLGNRLAYKKFIKFQLIGNFFNIAMLGTMGGDVVKGFYICKEPQNISKTKVFLGIFIDRLCGMIGIFLIGFLIFILSFHKLGAVTANINMVIIPVAVFFAGALCVAAGLLLGGDRIINKIEPYSSLVRTNSFAQNLKHSSQELKGKKSSIFAAIFCSLLIQGMNLMVFFYISTILMPNPVFPLIALVFPLGILISALPIAPAGLGAGHLAFEKLFTMVGFSSGYGANIFNIHTLGFLACFCMGGLAYLFTPKVNLSKQEPSHVSQ